MRCSLLLALALLVPAPADALILDSGDGQGNTSAPADDPGWAHVGRVSGLTGIYLGNGWVLTANHVPVSDPVFGGVSYPVVPGSVVQLQNPDDSFADLKVFRIDPSPSLPLLKIRSDDAGHQRQRDDDRAGPLTGGGDHLDGNRRLSLGQRPSGCVGGRTASLAPPSFGTWSFYTSFTKISQGGTTHEAQGADGRLGRGRVHQERKHLGAGGRAVRGRTVRRTSPPAPPSTATSRMPSISRSTAPI